MQKITTGGRLSLHEKQLYLDGKPIAPETIIISTYGKSEPLPGRVKYDGQYGWELERGEFIGFTYLDIPLDENNIPDIRVIGIK